MAEYANPDEWARTSPALPGPFYRVYRHNPTQIDYLAAVGVFRIIHSWDHYFFLAWGGLINIPHGAAKGVETNWLEFLRDDALRTAANPATVDPIIYPGAELRLRDWPEGFEPDEETLQMVRKWAVSAGIDRRGA